MRRERGGPLPFSTKLYQGIGAIPDTVKNWVFNTFTLLFYNQVLGMDAFLVSIALAVAIVFDAVTDPLAASSSDNLKSRSGRRHPLMYLVPISLITRYSITRERHAEIKAALDARRLERSQRSA